MAKAKLILENGMVFEGKAFGNLEQTVGEVVFNTGMTGYQEVLTDPSYYGQIVTMTYPLIGNYGINLEDVESNAPKVRGFVVREKCDASSNFRSELELDDYLKMHGIMGIEGVDTRALTRVLRNHGTMRGMITLEDLSPKMIFEQLESFDNTQAVYEVSTKRCYEIAGSGKHVAVMDFGVKSNILRNFAKRNCKMTVFPATATAEEVLSVNPDLVFLSNGPGDPADLTDIVATVKVLIESKPVVGICLGHQLLAIALGGTTAKLKFGHRGCNHPVKDISKNRVFITSQNHGYHVDQLPKGTVMTHQSLNDNTVEGMKHTEKAIFSVQFHPEASPGPVESSYLFDEFLTYAL